ncbi:MAG: hypothetical protein H0X39_19395 [Actinobacteria bacterium]|nr:hypothetical protein [Actinomycetota bacterium]
MRVLRRKLGLVLMLAVPFAVAAPASAAVTPQLDVTRHSVAASQTLVSHGSAATPWKGW